MDYAKELFLNSRHFTQIDPAKPISKETLDTILDSDTDAIIIAGTQDVTENSAIYAINKINRKFEPIYFAPSHPSQVGDKIFSGLKDGSITGLIVYYPLNSKNKVVASWPILWDSELDKKKIDLDSRRINLGYIVTNPYSTVGKLVKPDIRYEKIVKCAADCPFTLLYLDGSGKRVSHELIAGVRKKFEGKLIIGGGLKSGDDVTTVMASGGNAVNVGTVLEERNTNGYKDTIIAANVPSGCLYGSSYV